MVLVVKETAGRDEWRLGELRRSSATALVKLPSSSTYVTDGEKQTNVI